MLSVRSSNGDFVILVLNQFCYGYQTQRTLCFRHLATLACPGVSPPPSASGKSSVHQEMKRTVSFRNQTFLKFGPQAKYVSKCWPILWKVCVLFGFIENPPKPYSRCVGWMWHQEFRRPTNAKCVCMCVPTVRLRQQTRKKKYRRKWNSQTSWLLFCQSTDSLFEQSFEYSKTQTTCTQWAQYSTMQFQNRYNF